MINMPTMTCMPEDLKFFGTVSASISHEMKNVLAIINEMMGLLDDLSRMAVSGRGLDPERLHTIAGRMKLQIDRGDGIIRGLNRFAHSADHDEDTIDLGDMVRFVARLAARRAAVREIVLETAVPEEPLSVTTNAFALEHLIWAALEAAFYLCAPRTTLKMELVGEPQGPIIRLRAASPVETTEKSTSSSNSMIDLARRIGAVINYNVDAGQLAVCLPVDHSNRTNTSPKGETV
jgi:C4-dicarboxylate-specific signal transduction histidine kinase